MAVRDLLDARHLRGVAVKVHRHDSPGARRDGRFDLVYIDIEADRVDVHEYRLSACVQNRVGRGNEGEWDRDYFVSWPDLVGQQRHVQGGGAVAGGNTVLHSAIFGEPLLELGDLATLRKLPAVEDGNHRRLFFIPYL